MLKKFAVLGLLGVSVLGVATLPAAADTAVVQQGTQDLVIQGQGNTAVQSSQQINRIRRDRVGGSTENTGVVQDIYQGTTVQGRDNTAYQESNQVNVMQDVQRPHHRQHPHHNVTINQN